MRHGKGKFQGAFVLLLVGVVFGLVFASSAVATHNTPQFELEGDILDSAANPAPDWSSRFDASGNSLVGASCAFTADDLSTSGATDRTVFLGSNKNGDAVPSWEWGTNNNPPKDDLANVYSCTTSNAAGDTVLYAGLERLAPNGASHIDYELFQSSVGLDHAVPCPDTTECFFTGTRTVGDLIISVDFENGGAVGSVTLRRWNGTDYVVVSSGALGCNGADTICIFSNTTDIDGGPWPNFDEHGDVITTLPTNAFTEFGINLSQLLNGDVPCTASAVMKTRSSPSFTSTLMDFAFVGLKTCPVKSGTKFHDLNGNGIKDAGEPGLPGWTIRAYKDTNGDGTLQAGEAAAPTASAVTDANGNYSMTFPSGKYVVCEVLQAGWAQSFPTASGASCAGGTGLAPRGWAINLVGVVEDSGNDFGNYQQATKTGVKFEDLNANGVKDAGEPGLTGWGITAYVDVNGNGTKDAGDTTVAATTTTGSGGTYTLSLAPGKYIVCETPQAGWTQSFPVNTACGASNGGWGITLTSGQLDNNNDFGNYRQATKTGTKFEDLNANSVKDAGEPGLPGWTISAIIDTNGNGTLDAGETTVAASGVTNASGVYSLSLKPGKYIVCETQQAGWFQSWPANTLCGANAGGWGITLASGDVDSGNDFGNYRNATKSGMKFNDLNANGVKDAGEPGLSGWTINAFLDANSNGILDASEVTISNSAVTGAGGTYSMSLRPGRYVVCEVQQSGWVQSFPGNTVCGGAGKGGYGISLLSGQIDSDNDFGNYKVANANIQITPGTDTNEVGDPHVFTGHVNVDPGTGFVNAPAGTLITFSIVSGPGSLTPASCTTVGTTGSCTVTLNNTTAGTTIVNASTTVVVGGQTLTRSTGDGLTGDSPNAVKTWVDANIQISPLTDTNAVGDPHVFTGHVNVNTGIGGFVNAPAGTTINFTIVSGPGSLTPASCTTIGTTGSCTVTLNSSTAGTTTVRASTAVVVGGLTLNRATGDSKAGDSADATKVWVDANIQISPLTATNIIGQPHVFTGHVNINTGTGGFVNAPAGTTINFSIVSGPGSLTPASCTTVGTTGSCTVTLNNPSTPGVTTVSASTTVVVGGQTLNRATGDGKAGDSANAVKTWVDANIQISPLTATNALGQPHVFTGHVNINTGTGGYVNAPAGTTINFTIVSGPGSLSAASCTTVGTTGSCSVTLTNTTAAGVTTVRASTAVVVGGQTINRQTGDANAGDSANGVKTWVEANIQITPGTATNAVNSPHVFTGHVNINDGSGFQNAPAGTVINFSIVSGPGSLSAASCTTVGTTGSCTVTLNSSTAGVTTVHASSTVTIGGQLITLQTNGQGANSADAVKTWVDANIQISPLTATNIIGQPHVFTGHVNINTGTGGFVNAPAGTVINFSIVSGPGTLSAASCTTIGTTGSCTVTLNNPSTPGVTTVHASTTVTVGGQTMTRQTNGQAGNSVDAVKTWVDANIQISPLTATNVIGSPHVFTGHVNINTGTGGFQNAPAGTTINFTIVSGPGTLSAASCTTIGTTGSCTVTLNNPSTAGITTVRASTAVVVGGQTINRQTGDANAGDSANAVKTWVDANIQITPLQATNQLGDPHVFTGHVNINTGTGGYVNAPAGTTINFTIVSGPGALSAASCPTVGTTGECSVTLTNTTTSGQTTVRASTAVVVGGQTVNRATGDANAGDSPNAVKNWIGSLSGVKYNDLNGNGTRDENEPGLSGWTIRAYADTNGNGTLDAGETTIAGSATTGAGGAYQINGLAPGNYVLCEVLQPNWTQTQPVNTKCAAITGVAQGGYAVNLQGVSTNLNFGNRVVGNLILTKTATPETLLVGQNITYTITVHNAGTFPATQVVMTDPLPTSQVSFVSAGSTQGTCTGTGPVTCNIGTMAPGATVTITIVVKANVVGTVENPAHVSGFELETTLVDNDDSATVTVTAPFIPPATCRALHLSRTRVTVGRRFVVTATLRDTKGHLMAGKLIRVRGAGVWVNARTNAKGIAKIGVTARSEGTVRFTAATGAARCSASVRANAPFLPPLTG